MKQKNILLFIFFVFLFIFNCSTTVFAEVYSVSDFEGLNIIDNTNEMAFFEDDYLTVTSEGEIVTKTKKSFLDSLRAMYKKMYIEQMTNGGDNFTFSVYPKLYDENDEDTPISLNTGVNDFKYLNTYVLKIRISETGTEYTIKLMNVAHNIARDGELPIECPFFKEDSDCTSPDIHELETYKKMAKLSFSGRHFIKEIDTAIKEGIIAGSIEMGFNVVSAYSESQIPLKDIMSLTTGTVESNTSNDTDSGNATNTPTTSSKSESIFYEFKNSANLKLSTDYFVSPLFGKMDFGVNLFDGIQFQNSEGGNITKSEAKTKKQEWWDKQVEKVDVSTNGEVAINSYYSNFINGAKDVRKGVVEITERNKLTTDDISVVSAYEKGSSPTTTTKDPGQYMNYNMRVIVPNTFSAGYNGTYRLNEKRDTNAFKIIDGLRMCVYNDVFYIEDESSQTRICNANDLDLQRDYVMFYRYIENGIKMGAVVILKYDEGVIDTSGESGTPMLYKTGRKIVFNNGYSDSIKLDILNENLFGVYTRQQSLKGTALRNFVFPTKIDNTSVSFKNDISTICNNLKDYKYHMGLETAPQDFQIIVGFNATNWLVNGATMSEITDKEAEENEPSADGATDSSLDQDNDGKQDSKTIVKGFYILWNNTYIKNSDLLSWLDTKEAQGSSNVYAVELKKLIKGEFDKSMMTFEEWQKIQSVKGQLDYTKNTVLYRVVNIMGIFLGSFFIILALLLLLAYWIDIFNTFTDKSILYMLSARHLYPIAEDSMSDYLKGIYGSETKYVTFKQMLVIAIIAIIVGYFLLNISFVVEVAIKIYFTVLGLLSF